MAKSNDTHKNFNKDIEYKIRRIKLLIDQMDILIFTARQVCQQIEEACREAGRKESED